MYKVLQKKTFYELEKSIGASSVHKPFDLTDVSKPPEHTHTKFQHPSTSSYPLLYIKWPFQA